MDGIAGLLGSGAIALLEKVADGAMRVLGPFAVFFALALIFGVIAVYFTVLLPQNFDSGSLSNYVSIIIAIFLIVHVVFNYAMVVVTDAGSPGSEFRTEMDEEAPPVRSSTGTRYCRKCRSVKPPRTHHCSICRRCILKMDHHCPWVNRCVGFGNYRYFVLFMFWLILGCLYAGYLAALIFFSRTRYPRLPTPFMRTEVLFCMVICMAVSIALSILGGQHLYFIITGQTTIEFFQNRNQKFMCRRQGMEFMNEYDLGPRRNLQEIFGHACLRRPWLLLLPSWKPPPGDGVNFTTRSEYIRQLVHSDDYINAHPHS